MVIESNDDLEISPEKELPFCVGLPLVKSLITVADGISFFGELFWA